MDLELGGPMVDFNGNIVEADPERAFRQYIDVMLRTPIFGELFLPTWGLPLQEIYGMSFNYNWENMIKYFFLQSLNPQYEPLISEVKSIEVERVVSAINVTLHLQSTFGTELQTEVELLE